MHRIDSLDWQRGLLALAVMVYHLTSWELFEPDSSSLLGRLGIYGVSMFFILSGLSMAIVYNKYIQGVRSCLHFFVRRIFRIWPLFWVVISISVIMALLSGKSLNWLLVILNVTTIFGFVKPTLYMNTGAWSIGNEMVYYSLTPLIIYLFNKKVAYGNILTGVTFLTGIVFSSYILTADTSLALQWRNYVNPFNNLFLYCAGIAIFYNLHRLQFGRLKNALCFAVAFALFVFYPATGDQISIVTGANRLVFCFASIMLVIAFYKNTVAPPKMLAAPLTQLGLITYGVYLLHPTVHLVFSSILKNLDVRLGAYEKIGLTIFGTLILAQILLKVLEEPFIRLGKILTSNRSPGTTGAKGNFATATKISP